LTPPHLNVLITPVMARVCDLCGKGYHRAKLVPRLIGRRVSQRTLHKQQPNLRTVRMAVDGGNKTKFKMCTSCLKRMKKDRKAVEVLAENPEIEATATE
jgi:ribosomal protein L28